MIRFGIRVTAFAVLAVGLAASWSGVAHATLYTFVAKNHPNGGATPPPYGLRLDGIENYVTGNSGSSTTWTFDFDCAACSMTAVYDTIAETFTIGGVAFGGKDTNAANASDGYDAPGGGFVSLNFVYQVPLSIVDLSSGFPEFTLGGFAGGSAVTAPTASGTITFDDAIQSIASGTTVDLVGYTNGGGDLLIFEADQHRLDSECGGVSDPEFCSLPVGRGWLALAGDDTRGIVHTNYQDWLFVDPSVEIPTPGTLALLGVGLIGAGIVARRRHGPAIV